MSRKPSLRQLQERELLRADPQLKEPGMTPLASALKGSPLPPVGSPVPKPVAPEHQPSEGRNRLQVDLAPSVAGLLDHVSATLGVPKAQIVVQALIQALPDLVDRAELIRGRASEFRPQLGR